MYPPCPWEKRTSRSWNPRKMRKKERRPWSWNGRLYGRRSFKKNRFFVFLSSTAHFFTTVHEWGMPSVKSSKNGKLSWLESTGHVVFKLYSSQSKWIQGVSIRILPPSQEKGTPLLTPITLCHTNMHVRTNSRSLTLSRNHESPCTLSPWKLRLSTITSTVPAGGRIPSVYSLFVRWLYRCLST